MTDDFGALRPCIMFTDESVIRVVILTNQSKFSEEKTYYLYNIGEPIEQNSLE